MKDFAYTIVPVSCFSKGDTLWLTHCTEDGKWKETYARPTETEARSVGDIWVAEQQEMETFAEPVEFTQETVFVEMVETTWANLKRAELY